MKSRMMPANLMVMKSVNSQFMIVVQEQEKEI